MGRGIILLSLLVVLVSAFYFVLFPPGKLGLTEPIRTVNTPKPDEFAMSVGNRSFVPLDMEGDAGDHPYIILKAIYDFEQSHPQYEVVSWTIEERHGSYSATVFHPGHVFGIWVDHRSRNSNNVDLLKSRDTNR